MTAVRFTALMLAGAAALAPLSGVAQTTLTTTAIDHTRFGTVTDAAMAAHWGLEKAEIAQYRNYMALEGRYFYAHLDPVMVLGLIETDPQKRARYAEKYLLDEQRRVEEQTSFAKLVAATQLKRFGPQPVFDFSTLPQAKNTPGYLEARAARLGATRTTVATATAPPPVTPAALQAGDTVDLLIGPDCGTPCEDQLAQILESAGAKVLLYGRDFPDASALVAWLARWVAAAPGRVDAATRIQPRRFDPVVFHGMNLSTLPVALLRRNGVVVGTL